jgi:hypothetical protein
MIAWRQMNKDIKWSINHVGALVHFANVKTAVSLKKANHPSPKRPLPSAHHNSDQFKCGVNVSRTV